MVFLDIEVDDPNCVPTYAHEFDSGADLKACISEPVTLKPGERKLINTGLRVKLVNSVEAQIRPRSGLALKKGLTVLNTPGTVDAGYTGKIGVILINLSQDEVTVEPYERIAQLVFCPVERGVFKTVDSIEKSTERSEAGFGSSGTK